MDSKIVAFIIAILVAIIIVLAVSYGAHLYHLAKANREFMSGFWCASPEDCDVKGYQNAFMYIGMPENDTDISRAYIVALKGGSGHINTPFDFDVKESWMNGKGPMCGAMYVDGEKYDMMIDIDFTGGKMVWRDLGGKPLFVWEKNGKLSSILDPRISIAEQQWQQKW